MGAFFWGTPSPCTWYSSILRIQSSGEAGPDWKIIGWEHWDHLSHGAAVLPDPLECLQSVTRHLCHVPPAGCEVVPSQTTNDDHQQWSGHPFLVTFVALVGCQCFPVYTISVLFTFTGMIRVIGTNRFLVIIMFLITVILIIIIIIWRIRSIDNVVKIIKTLLCCSGLLFRFLEKELI